MDEEVFLHIYSVIIYYSQFLSLHRIKSQPMNDYFSCTLNDRQIIPKTRLVAQIRKKRNKVLLSCGPGQQQQSNDA